MDDFLARWSDWYPAVPPVSYVLRRERAAQWLRIHSLPGGKRYPAHWAERNEVLGRLRTAGEYVLGEGARCALLTLHTTDALALAPAAYDAEAADTPVLANRGLQRVRRLTAAPALQEHYEGSQVWLYGAEVTWSRTGWEPVLDACAEGQLGMLMWVALDSGRAFAPYDGGADLFFPRRQERMAARLRLGPWLAPARSGGS